jgi:Tfp pilus assembly protein PilF
MRKLLAPSGIVGVLVLTVVLASCSNSRQEAETRQLGLAHAAEVAGVCARALELLDANEPEKARQALETHLKESVLHADALVALGARIDTPLPNIRAGMVRAGAYAAQRDPRVSEAATRVVAALGPGPASGTR